MSTTPLLQITGLHAGYGRAEVLHGIDLALDKGRIITVIGPNGAGKSTLLNTLMGILPGKGSITYAGQPVQAMTLEERVMLGIALVPDFSAQAALQAGKLVEVLPDWRPVGTFSETIHAIRPYSAHVPRAVAVFVEWLREAFAPGFRA